MSRFQTYIIRIFLSALFFSGMEAYAQYTPDTSLTYAVFLKQCQDFARTGRDEVWVVNFWASYNGASLYTLPDLKKVHEDYLYKPVRFVSISVDKVRSNWEKRLPQYELPWEQLFLPREADYTFLQNAFVHNSLPGIFVVNSRAQVQRVRDTRELREVLALETQLLPDRPYQPSGLPDNNISELPDKEEPKDKSNDVSSVENGWMVHTVESGETLFSLYRKYGVSVSEIKRINSLTSNTIKVGQKIRIKRI